MSPELPSASDPHPLATTAHLVTQARAGDERARAELLERYREPLRTFVHRRLPARVRTLVETNDVVQDVQLAALQSLERFEYRGINSLWSYLRQIAIHLILREERKVDVRGNPQHHTASQVAGDGSSPSSHVGLRESIEAMETALGTLPDQVREAVLLRMELDLPYEMVARECGYPTADAARMAIVRAMASLAKELAAYAP